MFELIISSIIFDGMVIREICVQLREYLLPFFTNIAAYYGKNLEK